MRVLVPPNNALHMSGLSMLAPCAYGKTPQDGATRSAGRAPCRTWHGCVVVFVNVVIADLLTSFFEIEGQNFSVSSSATAGARRTTSSGRERLTRTGSAGSSWCRGSLWTPTSSRGAAGNDGSDRPVERPPRKPPIYYVCSASPDHTVFGKKKTAGRRPADFAKSRAWSAGRG